MDNQTQAFFCWGVSHHSAPLSYREAIAPTPPQIKKIYALPHRCDWLHELTVLSTCNRLEVYGTGYGEIEEVLTAELSEILQTEADSLREKSTLKFGRDALSHLFAVTAGLDSQIVGEVEITGQVKKAFLQAGKRGTVGRKLNQAFQKSFQTSKWIRSHTHIGVGQISVATVAVDFVLKIYGNLGKSTVLVIGAGDIAEKTMAALRSRGVRNLILSNRTFAHARALAEANHGIVAPFDSLDCHLITQVDIVVCSTSSREYIFDRSQVQQIMKRRTIRPLCLIDLALPRNIEPTIAALPNVFLYNLDDLAKIAQSNLEARRNEVVRGMDYIDRKSLRVMQNINRT